MDGSYIGHFEFGRKSREFGVLWLRVGHMVSTENVGNEWCWKDERSVLFWHDQFERWSDSETRRFPGIGSNEYRFVRGAIRLAAVCCGWSYFVSDVVVNVNTNFNFAQCSPYYVGFGRCQTENRNWAIWNLKNLMRVLFLGFAKFYFGVKECVGILKSKFIFLLQLCYSETQRCILWPHFWGLWIANDSRWIQRW